MKITKEVFLRVLIIFVILSVVGILISNIIQAFTVKYYAFGDDITKGDYLSDASTQSFEAKIAGDLGVEYNNLGESNITSGEFLELINSDKTYQDAIKDANIATLTIGEYDLIEILENKGSVALGVENDENFYKNVETELTNVSALEKLQKLSDFYDTVTSTSTQNEMETAISKFSNNLESIINKMKELNSKMNIVVIGYYNPYIDLNLASFTFGDFFATYVEKMNTILKNKSESLGYKVIDIYSDFNTSGYTNVDVDTFNLNPYPNADGHTVIYENSKSAIKEIIATEEANEEKRPESITISNSSNTNQLVLPDEKTTLQLSAKISPEDANIDTEITWTTSDAKVATVDSQGLVTGKGAGTATITATTANGVQATYDVTVVIKYIEPESITLNKTSQVLDLNGTNQVQLNATILPQNANIDTEITWTSSEKEVATVSSTGLVTALSIGTTTITATSANGVQATCEIEVQKTEEEIRPESITLNKTSAILDLNGTKTIQLEVTINPAEANIDTEITWTSSDKVVATVDNQGLVMGLSVGTTTITAKTANGIEATCQIEVQESIEEIRPESITLNQTVGTLDLNGTKTIQLEATINPKGANTDTEITWTSSDEVVATVSTTGLVTGLGVGTTTITAQTANGKIAKCEIEVQETEEEIRPESITLNKTDVILDLNGTKTIQLEATINPVNANTDTEITWTSSAEVVATVSTTGLVTALSEGTTTITAKTANGIEATCEIEVQETEEEIRPESITLNKTVAILDLNGTKTIQLEATINPVNANTDTEITWTSSEEEVATVSTTGGVTGLRVGTTTITAKTANGIEATCEIEVQETEEEIRPESITLNKTVAILDLNGTKTIQLEATINPEEANIDTEITWTSSEEEVATVSTTGVVTGLRVGTTTITAKTANGIEATCEIEVQETEEEIRPESITLNKTVAILDLNGTKTIQLEATINPEEANIDTEITWTSSTEVVAIVDEDGLVTALSVGTTIITAKTANGIEAICEIEVKDTKEEDNDNTIDEDNNNTIDEDNDNIIDEDNDNIIDEDDNNKIDEDNEPIVNESKNNISGGNTSNRVDTTTIEEQKANAMTSLSKLPYAGGRIKVIIFIVVIGLFGGFALFKCREYKKMKF